MFRPGDQAFFDILQSYQGYRTCYYRTFNIGRATPAQNDAYIKARDWLDAVHSDAIKPGVTTDQGRQALAHRRKPRFPERRRGIRVAIWPRAGPGPARTPDHLPRREP